MTYNEKNRQGLTLVQWLTDAGIERVAEIRPDHIRDWQAAIDPKTVLETARIWQAHHAMVRRRRNHGTF